MILANIRGEYGTTDYLAGTAAGGEDHHRASTPIAAAVRNRRGLQLLCVVPGAGSALRTSTTTPSIAPLPTDDGWDFS